MAATDSGYPGKRFGAAPEGPGSVASTGARVGSFLFDITISGLITWAFTAPDPPLNWSLLTWGVITVLGIGLFGLTPGHLVAGTRVATLRPAGRSQIIGLWAVPRTALVALLVPPLLVDADGRGWHDRVCRTIVVRSR